MIRSPLIRAVIVLVAVALVSTACRGTSIRGRVEPEAPRASPRATTSVTIEVSGTPGLRFGGAYGEMGDTKSIEGTIPTTLTFETAAGFTVALQKRAKEGELGIKVIVGGRAVNQASTRKEFGLVTYTQRASGK